MTTRRTRDAGHSCPEELRRHRHVVAMSMPIVYNFDGDCDRDGLVFAVRPHVPLLRWVREQLVEQRPVEPNQLVERDGRLLRLHVTAQQAQVVVDGLHRLEHMITKLNRGTDEERAVLHRLRDRELEDDSDDGEPDSLVGRIPRRRRESTHAHAIRTNLTSTLTEIRTALIALGDGAVEASDPTDAEAAEGLAAGEGAVDGLLSTAVEEAVRIELDSGVEPKLLTLTTAERQALRHRWCVQLKLLRSALRDQLSRLRFDAEVLARDAGMSVWRVRQLMLNDWSDPERMRPAGLPYDRCNPLRPMPLVEPLVLRARLGECLHVEVENQIRGRRVGFHVQGDALGRADGAASGDGVRYGDGSCTGLNPDSTIPAPVGGSHHRITYTYGATHEGVWLIHDSADVRGSEQATNIHGLFGAVIIEPAGTRWRDPETGKWLDDTDWDSQLLVDVLHDHEPQQGTDEHQDFVDFHSDDVVRSFREFTVFIHDEPEVHSGVHAAGLHSWMPLSYRAEPMVNRLPHRMRRMVEKTALEPDPDQVGVDRNAFGWELGPELDDEFWTARTPDGRWLERIAGEEQHHSSWLFGEPATPVLRAYRGDPCRVRLVHAGIKETHIYHLHVHQWRAVAADTAPPGVWGVGPDGSPLPKGSQLLDSITISPQTCYTIDPLYGSGSRQHAFGDIIWHCHLYPHFHHGMWGLWRSLDRYVDGSRAYPDGTPCPELKALPGRDPEPPTEEQPGFPWFMAAGTELDPPAAGYPMKSPPPPAPVPEQVGGRRHLLQLPPHTKAELAAMPPAVRDGHSPGAIFVDLDGDADRWLADAQLPWPRRIVSYELESRIDRIDYNSHGWHDPRGCRYRLRRARVREQQEPGGPWQQVSDQVLSWDPGHNPEPMFPRANHGDIVELRMFNELRSLDADQEDLAMHPVECGLHVHLVKFDVLSADGSATGWNYLSGASCREAVGPDVEGSLPSNVSLHRWVVDEEFGPCFFHDHLLANYRQKHGLWSALIAEPHGSQWHRADDQGVTAWADPQAVIVPDEATGLPPYREACLGVQDFVPLLDRRGRSLNPPSVLSGVDDPGVMAVSYRNAPMHFRGDDPSLWFSTTTGDPDTALIETYPGERLRIRLIQGSHEEGHSFQLHGMRWRRDWGAHERDGRRAPLVNQQTLGISEAFTLEIDPADASAYGVGDHLWHMGGLDDQWLGCWGYVRALRDRPENLARLAPLPQTAVSLPADQVRRVAVDDTAQDAPVRTFVVVADRTEHQFRGAQLTDPWGLIYRVADYADDAAIEADLRTARMTDRWPVCRVRNDENEYDKPLVLRARRGERIRVILVNLLLERDAVLDATLPRFGVEVAPPRLFVEHTDELGRPDRRTVSPQVSLHVSLLQYDVRHSDGSFVGRNPDQTVGPWQQLGAHGGHVEGAGPVVHRAGHAGHGANWRVYEWYADEALAPETSDLGPGQVCVLKDMGDVRNHRHHGLIGALVVLPGDVTPWAPGSDPGAEGAAPDGDGWSGVEADVRRRDGTELVARDAAVFFQDGLRQFVGGDPTMPVADVPLEDENELDSGLKAISYRTALIHRGTPPRDRDAEPPLVTAAAGTQVWLRVVGAGDKLRQHCFTLHDLAWEAAPWVPGGAWTAASPGVVGGWAEDVVVRAAEPGDHALRTGCYRFGTEMGVWSMLRVNEAESERDGRS